MISERKLASSHASFWHHAMPLADAFVRAMNLSLERFAPPRPPVTDPSRNALVSELAFRLYAEFLVERLVLETGVAEQAPLVRELAEQVREYVSRLERGASYETINEAETEEAFTLAARLATGLSILEPNVLVRARPRFAGCGSIADCEGDLLAGATLYEVKNVDRHFRIADIRQVLCYCALNSASAQYVIDTIGLVNARSGVAYRLSLNALSLAAAGVPATDLLSEIVSYIVADRPSK